MNKNLIWLLSGAAVLYYLWQKQSQFTFTPTGINAPALPTLPTQTVSAPTPPSVNFVAGTGSNVASGYTPDFSTFGIG